MFHQTLNPELDVYIKVRPRPNHNNSLDINKQKKDTITDDTSQDYYNLKDNLFSLPMGVIA